MSAPTQQLMSYGSAAFTAGAVDLDGTNDYYTRGAGWTGAADGSLGTFSCWVRYDGSDGVIQSLIRSTGSTVRVRKETSNFISAALIDSTGALLLLGTSTITALTAGSTWHHIFVSWSTNLGIGSKLLNIYVDGVTQSPTITDVSLAFNVDYTVANWGTGANETGAAPTNGCVAEFFLDIAHYTTNTALFASGGHPISLGTDGSTPFSAQPILYQHIISGGTPSDFGTNLGSGGGMTINGSPVLCSSSP